MPTQVELPSTEPPAVVRADSTFIALEAELSAAQVAATYCQHCNHPFHHAFHRCCVKDKPREKHCTKCECLAEDKKLEKLNHCGGPCPRIIAVKKTLATVKQWLEFIDKKHGKGLAALYSPSLTQLVFDDFLYLILFGDTKNEKLTSLLLSKVVFQEESHKRIIQAECEKLLTNEHEYITAVTKNKEKYVQNLKNYFLDLGEVETGDRDTTPNSRSQTQVIEITETRKCSCNDCCCFFCATHADMKECQCIRCDCPDCSKKMFMLKLSAILLPLFMVLMVIGAAGGGTSLYFYLKSTIGFVLLLPTIGGFLIALIGVLLCIIGATAAVRLNKYYSE